MRRGFRPRAGTSLPAPWRVAILLAAIVGLTAPAAAELRRALVIGVDDYQSVPKLKKAVGDARAMETALKGAGFAVDLLVNPDRRGLNAGISAFTAKLQPGDTALVHFSGHGVQIDGENFLLPADIPQPATGDKEFLKAEGIGLSVLV